MNLDLLDFATQYGVRLCKEAIPNSELRTLYEGMVCGQTLPNSDHKRVLLDTGLIHVLVVSGAHLHFLERWLRVLPQSLRTALLFLYCWLCGFNPPVTRAWIARMVRHRLENSGQRFSPLQTEAFVSVLVLLLIPSWFSSLSFHMSWMCALALSVPKIFPRYPHFSTCLSCYAFLFFFIPMAPTTIVANLVLVPIIGIGLLPLCLIAIFIPPLIPLMNSIWNILFAVLAVWPQASPADWRLPMGALAALTIATHLLLLIGEVHWRRRLAFSSSY
ncbi:MAG: ComEC/Rec2 family competence protein [Bdellovibrionales bacterium]